MKYTKRFDTETNYDAFRAGDKWVTPNICVIEETDEIRYKPLVICTFTAQNNSYRGPDAFTTKTFMFVEGMTWREFVNSAYNTDGFMVSTMWGYDYVVRFKDINYTIGTSKGAQNVAPDDEIIANHTYHIDAFKCFVSGTQVLTSLDGETKNIEDIKTGDNVISYDIDNNENYEAIVTTTYVNDTTYNMAKVACADGTILEMSNSHPLYTKDGWKSITRYHNYPELVVGDIVKTIDDWSEVVSIETYTLDEPVTTYTFNVKDKDEEIDIDTNDGFYANGVLAHNKASTT